MQLWNQRRLPELAVEERPAGAARSMTSTMLAGREAPRDSVLRRELRRAVREQVVKPFVDDYLAGRTPIPCTLCNNFIKFDQFLEMAEGVGAEDRDRPLRPDLAQ